MSHSNPTDSIDCAAPAHPATPQPSAWVARWLALLPAGARVLDFAAGSGRHALLARALGARVLAVDRDPEALAALAALAAPATDRHAAALAARAHSDGSAESGETAPPAESGETAPPAESGETVPPAESGETAPPAESGETVPPAESGETVPPAESGETVPPAESGETAPRRRAPGAIDTAVLDLEGGPWQLPPAAFDAVIVANYLFRPRFALLCGLLAPGGLLIYETFGAGNEALGKPSNPAFLLREGELLERVRFAGLTVVGYESGSVRSPRPAIVQRVCAVRPPLERERLALDGIQVRGAPGSLG